MKKLDWKSAAELVGIAAVVFSLVFVGLELRQTRLVARIDVMNSLLSSHIELSSAISQNAELWVQGATGRELSEAEAVVFEELVINVNNKAITEYLSEDLLGNTEEAESVMDDFAAVLHQNPGARRTWLAREENLNRYRRLLRPDVDLWSFWQEEIVGRLEVLDERSN